MRGVRKITLFLCTRCHKAYLDHASAKACFQGHATETPARAPRRTQTSRVLLAVRGGARDAATISKKTGIELARVHALLTYLRKRGEVSGFSGHLRAK